MTKKKLKEEYYKMWFDSQSTIFNWEGLFKEQSFMEKMFGFGEWRDSGGIELKKVLSNFIWNYFEQYLKLK